MRLTIVCLFAFYSLGVQAQVKALVGNIKTEKATKTEILVQPFLKLHYDSTSKYIPGLCVTSFTFNVQTKADSGVELKNTGNYFNTDIKQAIKLANIGSKLYFDNIKVKGPDGTTRTLMPFNLTIR